MEDDGIKGSELDPKHDVAVRATITPAALVIDFCLQPSTTSPNVSTRKIPVSHLKVNTMSATKHGVNCSGGNAALYRTGDIVFSLTVGTLAYFVNERENPQAQNGKTVMEMLSRRRQKIVQEREQRRIARGELSD